MKTVGEVSALAGITVRTLHHYDELGLLSPSGRSDSGYRLYSERDLERLQEILGWRALGFSLEEVAGLLGDAGHDRLAALRGQRELVDSELARLAGLARALDRAIATIEHGHERQEAAMFNGFAPSEYEHEARERWGHTDAYKESTRRVASYGEEQWREIKAQAREIERLFAELKRSGQPPDGEPARAAAEQARRHIDRWFYPCSHECTGRSARCMSPIRGSRRTTRRSSLGWRPTSATRSSQTQRAPRRSQHRTLEPVRASAARTATEPSHIAGRRGAEIRDRSLLRMNVHSGPVS